MLYFSLGPIVCGVFASIFAYGIMVVQCHFYFQWYKKYVRVGYELRHW